jgi:hypothetical protein
VIATLAGLPCVALLAVGLLGGMSYAAEAQAERGLGEWRLERRERGITVSRREQAGEELEAFRGQGQVKAHVLQVLAVILDVREVERWAYGVTDAHSVRHVDDRTELVYLYSDTPWPVRDRDMVVRRSVHIIKAGSEFGVTLRCEPDASNLRTGVIRVRACNSSFRIRKVDAETTEITYEMSLDPEGVLPSWASTWVARTAPVKTLLAIEARAARNQGRYAAFVQRWSTAM